MSAIRLTYLYCDGGKDCPRRDGEQEPFKIDPLPYESGHVQRQQAKQAGWVQRGSKDFCPSCAAASARTKT